MLGFILGLAEYVMVVLAAIFIIIFSYEIVFYLVFTVSPSLVAV